MNNEGSDLEDIRAAFKRLRLGDLTASEYHHALKNAGRPVGRPKKPKSRCARCAEIDRRIGAWDGSNDADRRQSAALLAELQHLFRESGVV